MLPNPAPIQNAVVDKQTGKATQFWVRWFTTLATAIGQDKAFYPPTISDANSNPNSIYFSSTSNKLVYKDSSGVVHALY